MLGKNCQFGFPLLVFYPGLYPGPGCLILDAALSEFVAFPFGVLRRMWKSIVSVPDH